MKKSLFIALLFIFVLSSCGHAEKTEKTANDTDTNNKIQNNITLDNKGASDDVEKVMDKLDEMEDKQDMVDASEKDKIVKDSEIEKDDMMDDKKDTMMNKEEEMKKEKMMDDSKGEMAKTEEMEKDNMMDKKGVYTSYSPEAVSNASGNIVLFFHANWCPSCVALDKKIPSEEIPS